MTDENTRPCNEVLIEKLSDSIDYMRQEWEMTYTEVIGCLEVVKDEILQEIRESE